MEDTIKQLDPHTQRFLTTEGFIERYFMLCGYYPTLQEAYEQTERQYATLTGQRKYASYKSFKVSKNKFLKKNSPQT